MDKGWTLPEIDGMDLCWYLQLLGHKQKPVSEPAPVTDVHGSKGLFIDQFGLF